MRFAVSAALVAAVVVASSACSSASGVPGGAGSGAAIEDGPLATLFASSAAANGVPRDLMIAIAQTEGSLDMPRARDVDPSAAVPVAGPLQLRHGKLDTLARGAALMRTTELALRQDSDVALEASARVLAEVGASTGARGNDGDLATWQSAIEEMSGYADDAHRKSYARRVFALLARGGTLDARDGERIVLPSHDLAPTTWMAIDTDVHPDTAPADYGPAEWFPTSCNDKCTLGRAGNTVQYVVIHDTEGGWDASVATLQNDPGKSVQYIVGTDGKVGQFIHEVDTAWHAGNFYYNERSIGIEHVGYSTKPYTNAQYTASALLVAHLTDKYGVPKTRTHIIGHDQIPNGNVEPESSAPCSGSPKTCETGDTYGGADEHRDPGVWEWCTYMARFGGSCKCNDVTGVLTCSVDKTEAFRCVGGKVELDACTAGCVTKPSGQDDVCSVAAKGADGGPGPSDDAGAAEDSGTGPSTPPVTTPDGGAPSAPDGGNNPADPGAATPTSDAGGSGCSAAPLNAPGEAPWPGCFALVLGCAVALRRRGARRR